MIFIMFKSLLMLLIAAAFCAQELLAAKTPHIIFIVADDLGWNDVGFHGSLQVPTPNIDALAYSGIILQNYYVQPICTPSRSALMSGLHPIHTGLQHDVIYAPAPYGLPLDIKLLPEHLKDVAPYKTAGVGKWHLGLSRSNYTPVHRGFDSHYGYWTGHIDYFDHKSLLSDLWGYDFRNNMDVAHDAYGRYATDLFTNRSLEIIGAHNASEPLFLYLAHLAVHSANPYEPLQAPLDVINKFSYIEDKNRRIFAAMLSKLDESVGAVVKALTDANMLEDSIIVFTTDNGGPAGGFNSNAASNYPLRGVKAGMWEGGVRGAGLVWSPRLPSAKVSHSLMTIEDWLPTLYAAAGGDPSSLPPMDGVNMWPQLLDPSTPSDRTTILHNIDPTFNGGAIRMGDYKLITVPSGNENQWDNWFGPSGRNETAAQTQLPVIMDLIRKSPAGQVVLNRDPNALNNMEQTRTSVMVNCTLPEEPTFFCRTEGEPCLFHITTDPCETKDIAAQYPDIVTTMMAALQQFNKTAVPILNKPWDPLANPKYWNYNWNNWLDYPPPPYVNAEQLRKDAHRDDADSNFSLFNSLKPSGPKG